MKTRCLILDDEPLARDVLVKYIENFDSLELVGQCTDVRQAGRIMNEKPIDLLFLDVELPSVSGIEFLKSLKYPPQVIFTTAHRHYAFDGFELGAVDYLMKPIKFERFMQAISRYHQLADTIHVDFRSGGPCIFVRENKRVIRIRLCDILYIEGLGEYVKINTVKRKVVTKMGMSEIAEKLPHRFFLRIHKSYTVCLAHVDAFTNSVVELGDVCLPIGRSFKRNVMNILSLEGSVTGV